jgi:GlpG protein
MIGSIPGDSDAERFSDYLVTQKIPNMVEQSAAGSAWDVWVDNDDDIDRAKREMSEFLKSTADAKYDAKDTAEQIRKDEERKQKKRRAKFIDYRTQSSEHPRVPAITIVLIILSLVVTIATNSINLGGARREAMVDRVRYMPTDVPKLIDWARTHAPQADIHEAIIRYWLATLQAGQVWRLISPIFIHLTILHLIFNMFWLRDLGWMIENRRGAWRFLGLVLVVALLSNFAEFLWELPHLANFGGMSGVVYGLFGYVWVKQKFEPQLGMGVSEQTAWIMTAWLFACMTGVLGPIANAAHVAGLIVGAATAYAPIALRRIRRQ